MSARLCSATSHLCKDLFMDHLMQPNLQKSQTNMVVFSFVHSFTGHLLYVDHSINASQWSKKSELLKPELVGAGIQERAQQNKSSSCNMPSLHEMLASLEQGLLPPCLENFASTLHRYRGERNLDFANRLHDCIRRSGLEDNTSLGNPLVLLLVEVGSIHKAQQVFDRLDHRSDLSWNALIVGYIKSGDFAHAFTLFQKMQKNVINVNLYTFVALIKACAKLKDLKRGQEIHDEVSIIGLETDLFVGSALINLYANCGLLAKAQEMFNKLPFQDVVSWNSLIAGYAQHGHGEEALKCFQQMQLEGCCVDNVTYLLSLKACGSVGAIRKGQEIHCGVAIQRPLERDLKVSNALVDMYAKCGLLWKAKDALNKLPFRDAVSWNALIAGYAKQGLGQEALNCYEQMHSEGVFPDAVTLACSLKACGSVGAVDTGRRIHVEIHRKGLLDRDIVVGNALVDMYAKCGLLSKAQAVFHRLPHKDAVSWTALITGFVQHGNGEEALHCFEQMQMQGLSPDAVTLLCSLKACTIVGALDVGHQIHAELARRGLMERDLIGNTLIDMYAKFGLLGKAQEIFDNFSNRDVVSWNALIGGYAEHGYGEEALECFEQMQLEGVSLDAVTFVCILNACGDVGAMQKGHEIYAEVVRKGLLEKDIVLGNALVAMYAKCGAFAKAWEVVDKLPIRHNASWNAIIAGYVQHKLYQEALDCYKQMLHEAVVVPDTATYVSVLKACSSIRAAYMGCETHAEIVRKELLENNLVIGNVLVDMYCNCGSLAKAQEVFDSLSVRDVISWTLLIAGYTKHGHNEEALELFEEMQLDEFSPNVVTYIFILAACGSVGSLEMGQAMHAEISRKGLLDGDLVACNVIVDMYANCGLLANAQEIFDNLSIRNIVSWSSLIAGYAQMGKTEKVFLALEEMKAEGENPNLVTVISVLNACSHAGLVDEGQAFFKEMRNQFDITPSFEHHICILDLLSRAGQLIEANAMIMNMPFHPSLVVWHTMLGACKKWDNVDLGREAFEHAMQLDKKDVASFVCIVNIYAEADMLEEAP